MQATLSTEGYDRVRAEWAADDALLAQQGDGGGFGMNNYYIALIGAPSETDPWQWQWGGHHVTVNATIGHNLSLNPSFIGVQPATYTDATATRSSHRRHRSRSARPGRLARRFAAERGGPRQHPIDLVLGPGQDGKTIQPEGLPGSQTDRRPAAAL